MLAVDTNILVRLAVQDDADQVRRALAAIKGQDAFVSATVLLELEWVLRRVFKLPRIELARVLRTVCGLPFVTIEQPERIKIALADLERGIDFADALHLRGAQHCAMFLTFDRKLIRAAADLDSVPVREP